MVQEGRGWKGGGGSIGLFVWKVLDWKRVILLSTTVEYSFESYQLWPWKE